MTAAAPSGVVTFLFTDVEGSTRRWESDAELMRKALAAHDEVLRSAIEAHGGFMFKHTGDGVCAAFSSPRAAVDAAVVAQRALELPVRMGLATGEAELRADDYFGAVLNRAARVMAAGHGGQILLADSTAGLLSGVDLVPMGRRRLRDIAKPVDVFQVQAAGLRTDFAPLRTADPTPGNLRTPSTSLIGREAELVELQTVMKVHRLVTLTGVGGVGKTRLALEAAARIAHDFPDGVFVIELAPVGDPAVVPEAVAAVLGVIQQPGMSVSDSVAAALEERSRLLVLDNCEHVVNAAAAMIESILARSASVKILATSREGLRVADEQLWPVPSLDLNSSATTLFVERASSTASVISLGHDADAVAEICRRLDGIPLAIELAASRTQSMTVTEVRDLLDDRFRLLVGSRRGLQRHQTLRRAVEWSYELLDDTEKALLRRVSVFAGGFDLDGATALEGRADKYATLDVLDSLVRKSLLVADRDSARTRFSMLETIRRFADEQLVASGEASDVRTAHARYFTRCEADILAVWDSTRQREAYAWFTVELANLRTAFRWAADRGDLDIAATIATFASFLGGAVANFEPLAWAEELLNASLAVDHSRRALLSVMASQCWITGRIDDAARYSDDFCDFDDLFPALPYFGAQLLVGGVYMITGQPDRAVDWYRTELEGGHNDGHLSRVGLALTLSAAGRLEEAVAAAEALTGIAQHTRNPYVVSFALLAYGYVLISTDPHAALDAFRRGMTVAQDSGNSAIESHLLSLLARVEAEYGDPRQALDHIATAIQSYHDSGNTTNMHLSLAILAALLHWLGRQRPAATIAGFAINPFTTGTAGAPLREINSAIVALREALGDVAYESLARAGEHMTTAAMATYAYDQIDQARAELNSVSE